MHGTLFVVRAKFMNEKARFVEEKQNICACSGIFLIFQFPCSPSIVKRAKFVRQEIAEVNKWKTTHTHMQTNLHIYRRVLLIILILNVNRCFSLDRGTYLRIRKYNLQGEKKKNIWMSFQGSYHISLSLLWMKART